MLLTLVREQVRLPEWELPRRVGKILAIAVFTAIAVARSVRAAPLPAPWAGQDIGSPVPAGSLSFDENTFTINGGGSDIWNASDHFFFVYQPISGDVDIRARVNSLLAPSDWSKAGVMIRASLEPNAAHGIALVSGSRGAAFQDRPAAGHISVTSQGPRA